MLTLIVDLELERVVLNEEAATGMLRCCGRGFVEYDGREHLQRCTRGLDIHSHLDITKFETVRV